MQAGKQIEYLTGGHVLAGYHEVVVTDDTIRAIDARKKGGKSLWRVSSTLFSHIQSDHILKPLEPFNIPEKIEEYPPIFTGDQVQKELQAIKLDRN